MSGADHQATLFPRVFRVLFGGLLATALASPGWAETPPENQPQSLVKIGDFMLTDMHFALFASQTGRNPADQEGQLNLLNELVNNFMVAKSPEGQALAAEPEVKAALEVASARLLAQTFVRSQLEQMRISEEALQARYDERYGTPSGSEYKASHILLEDEQAAKDVIAELDAGADFAELARTRSTGPSKRVGGDLGWFGAGEMVDPFFEATTQLDDGSYSKVPVNTDFGFHVILREDSRPVTAPTLEEARERLTTELQQEQVAAAVTRIRENMAIEVQSGEN